MTPAFSVLTTPRFERLLRRHVRRHRDLVRVYGQALDILALDPYDRSRQHAIKKLENVDAGDGQYRLRIGRWRFRYDVESPDVILVY